MGDPTYDERQRLRKERELEQELHAHKREMRDAKANDLFDLFAQSLTDFLEGRACLSVEVINDTQTSVRFTKA